MDSEGVKKYFKNLLECLVCFQIIDSVPKYQCQNGHVVCKDCYPKLETCTICRDNNLYDNRFEEIVKRLQLSKGQLISKCRFWCHRLDQNFEKWSNHKIR